MGGYIGQIGAYELYMPDYVFDYVKQSQPKEYYEKYEIKLEFAKILDGFKKENPWVIERNKEEETLKLPLLSFGKLKKLRKYYRFEWDYNLEKLLWDELEKRNIKIKGYVFVRIHVNGGWNHKDIWNYYYLTSIVEDDDITLSSTIKKMHTLTSYDELSWLFKKGFIFSQKIKE